MHFRTIPAAVAVFLFRLLPFAGVDKNRRLAELMAADLQKTPYSTRKTGLNFGAGLRSERFAGCFAGCMEALHGGGEVTGG